MLPPRARRAALLLLVWNGVALVMGPQIFLVERTIYGRSIPWWNPFLTNFLTYLIWWVLTPLVLALGRRFPLDRQSWRSNLRVHAAASVVIPCLYLVLSQA